MSEDKYDIKDEDESRRFRALTDALGGLMDKYGFAPRMTLVVEAPSGKGLLLSTSQDVSNGFLINSINAVLHSAGGRIRHYMQDSYDLSTIGDEALAIGTLLAQLGPDGVRVMSEVARMPCVLSESTRAPDGATIQ